MSVLATSRWLRELLTPSSMTARTDAVFPFLISSMSSAEFCLTHCSASGWRPLNLTLSRRAGGAVDAR